MSVNERVLTFLSERFTQPEISAIPAILDDIEAKEMSLMDYILLEEYASENDIYLAISEFFDIEFQDFELIEKDKDLINSVNINTMRTYGIVPIRMNANNELTVAITDPLNVFTRTALNSVFPTNKQYILCAKSLVYRFLDSLKASTSTTKAINEFSTEKITNKNIEEKANEEELNAPAVRLAESIIQEALISRASDIHVEPFERSVRVRNRIDGTLYERATFDLNFYPAVKARLKIMANMNIAESRIPQDGRVKYVFNGDEIDFRVSTMPTAFGEKFVIRILDKSTFSFKRQDLCFSDEDNLRIDTMLSAPHGIILITGPTGSGKSTTMYSFLQEMNKVGVNISTVEDPIEYTIDGINQTQVNPKANLTFATVLRSFLRQDPNIMMVGEIRDEETAQIAVRAAITGHLVLSTLHTNDAPGALVRLIDMGIRPYLLADSIVGVTAQRLVKRLCPHCRQPYTTSPAEMEVLKLDTPQTIYRAKGCPYCSDTGYRGRVAVQEVMLITEEIRQQIGKDAVLDDIRVAAEASGMVPLYKACCKYVLSGKTTMTELDTLASNISLISDNISG